jgi:hypothetical protein
MRTMMRGVGIGRLRFLAIRKLMHMYGVNDLHSILRVSFEAN